MEELLIPIIVALVAVPAIAARDPDPRRGVRRTVLFLLAFTLVYVGYVTLVHATWAVPAE